MCYMCRCWVGKGWHVSTICILGDTFSGCVIRTPGWAPWGLVLSTPLVLFTWVSRILLSVWFEWYLVSIVGRTSSLLQYSCMMPSGETPHTRHKQHQQKVLVFSDGKQSFEPCLIDLFGVVLFRLDTNSSHMHSGQYDPPPIAY